MAMVMSPWSDSFLFNDDIYRNGVDDDDLCSIDTTTWCAPQRNDNFSLTEKPFGILIAEIV